MTADQRHPLPPPPQHPDLDTLADHDAGALDGSTAERVAAHVAGCPRCTASLAALAAVRGDLRALPSPPMPAAVTARLDSVLADLRRGEPGDPAGRPALASVPAPPPSSRPQDRTDGARDGRTDRPRDGRTDRPAGVGPQRPRDDGAADLAMAREQRRRRRSRRLSAVAAAFVLLAAGASVGALVRTGTGGSDNGGTAASAPLDTEQGAVDSGGSVAPAPVGIPSYSKDTLRASLPDIEQESAVGIITGRGDTGPAGAMADTARRTACAGTIRGSSGDLRAVRRISYDGRPAYVFVFAEAGRLTAYVVSDECGASAALPAAVLDTVS